MSNNKILLLCEGKNEEKVLDILLDNNCLIFNRDNLIARRAIPLPSNIKTPFVISSIKQNGEMIDIIRVKDSQKDLIRIPKEIKKYVSLERVYDYCTKPSIEILLIMNEGLLKEFNKVKSKKDAKDFAKENIKYNGRKYDNSTAFYESYFGGKRLPILLNNIKAYKQNHSNKRNENYLADLLKQKDL